ncbi:hypothetical protein ACFV6E_35425 [Streptomyces sp. NPDC059785]|uniref:hypothetical protein n=1 Tax=unclassified Streptomyces TaxID=2593676 RepID=UPI00365178F0
MSDSVPWAGGPQDPAAAPAAPGGKTAAGADEVSGHEPERPDPPAGPGPDPSAPAPLHVPRTPTGNADVDAYLGRLADADHLATDGHVEVYEDVHRGLRDALTALDTRPGPPGPPGPSGSPKPPYDRRS